MAVLIYDEDHITDDDLIGSVQVNLESLDPWVPTERWVQVQSKSFAHLHERGRRMHAETCARNPHVDCFGGVDARNTVQMAAEC